MHEDEECDHGHMLIDDSSAQGGDKENYSIGEDNSNTCKDVVIEMELMQLQVEYDLQEKNLETKLKIHVTKIKNTFKQINIIGAQYAHSILVHK